MPFSKKSLHGLVFVVMLTFLLMLGCNLDFTILFWAVSQREIENFVAK